MSGGHAAHAAALETLQSGLAGLYRVEQEAPVGPFLLDADTLQGLALHGAIRPRPGAREEVFVLDDGHEVNVALWLDERALEAASDAIHAGGVVLNAEQFTDFCVALEGVSHFVLVHHRAITGQPVTQLELELQAEVDKYVIARLSPWMHARQLTDDGVDPRVTARVDTPVTPPAAENLHAALFDHFLLAPHLQDEQAQRYAMANRLARRYCARLERRYLAERRPDDMLRELCAFYRKSQADRLCHIGP
ncbi:MAG: hypothetical protein HY904_11225 [Deltaproteobacteria bacterium]|nr:hypothetical protein [Deltaproteobacteria bacterium]